MHCSLIAIVLMVSGVAQSDAGVPSRPPITPAVEEPALQEGAAWSYRDVHILEQGPDPTIPCKDGTILDWRRYDYDDPRGPDDRRDRWRCVKPFVRTGTVADLKVTDVMGTYFYSNFDAATHKRFRQRLKEGSFSPGFVWKETDDLAVVYNYFPTKSDEPNRKAWDFQMRLLLADAKGKTSDRFVTDTFPVYTEPKIRLFHVNPRHDIFIIEANTLEGTSHLVVNVDKVQKIAVTDTQDDRWGLNTFDRFAYVLFEGRLWWVHEERRFKHQERRLFNYSYWENDGWVYMDPHGKNLLPPPPPPWPPKDMEDR